MDTFLSQSLQFAKDKLMEDGQLYTMIIGETGSGERTAFVGVFKNDEEKETYLRMVTMSFVLLGVHRYIALSEAWMSTVQASKNAISHAIRPSEDPKRKECLLAALISYFSKETQIFEIKRNNQHKVVDLTLLQKMNRVEGRFTELLPPSELDIPKRFQPLIQQFIHSQGLTIH
jgi:hypothetical protein